MLFINVTQLSLKLRCKTTALRSTAVVLLFLSPTVIADSRTASSAPELCPPPGKAAPLHTPPPVFPVDSRENIEISADKTTSSSDGSTRFIGNVIIEKHLLRMRADQAAYNKPEEKLSISGDIHIDTPSLSLDASRGSIDMTDDNRGVFTDIRFYIPQSNMKGMARTIMAEGDDKKSELSQASITSCPLTDPDWLISADEIDLDHADEYGSAKDVVIRFKGVPFLYTPYIEFPTSDRRRSGLLFPEVGTSTSRGIELAAPWYWNIAANQDAVIVPRYMQKRGLELGGNYRFLTRSTSGELRGAYLHEDKLTQEKRYQLRYLQHSRLTSALLFDADYQDISDKDYFNDFSNSLGSTSRTHLNRSASLKYAMHNWQLNAMVQDIKTIDTDTPLADRPYKRLPQLTLNGKTQILQSPLFFGLDSELVDFAHEDSNKTTGTRLRLLPALYLDLTGTAWFFKPKVKLAYTQYDVGPEDPNLDTTASHTIPMSSIDTGLFFERNTDSGYLHTLEPRLYYLYVPYEDQSRSPLFDTSTPEFSVAQLFRDNRFVGGDRIGDTNQLTVALSSRLLSPGSGNQLIRASIGQIFYFEDRNISITGAPETARQSDVIGELESNWGHWQSNIAIQWDTRVSRLSKENYFLHYQHGPRHLFNIGYRKRLKNNQIDIEQTDTSFVYGINREYTAFARWNYSLDSRKSLDTIAGIAYDSCCWSIQLLGQHRIQNSTSVNAAYDNAILVQFVLKGLGSLSGTKARSTLQQSIYGYSDVFQ
ncbi:MAG TPA: LPS-assembly protein LptD [Gammaproteobacteria bacterium]|nr:LPS-assembly protein LptD [Gammaproteobacteria bacterium]